MASDNSPHPPASTSYFQKTVTLLDWWLTKPQTHDHTKTLGVAGLTSQQKRAARWFSSAPILQVLDLFELETVDGVCVILQGFINKDRTLANGFSPDVFNHFVIGFPSNWQEYCSKVESAAKCVPIVQEEDGKTSIEGHDFHYKSQNCDSNTVDMGVEDRKDTELSNKDSTPLDPSSDEVPHEHIIEAGNIESCEKSTVAPEFKDNPILEVSPIVSNTMDSSTRSKCLKVSSRRMTRSMNKMANNKINIPLVNGTSNLNKKAVNVVDCDMKVESKRKQIDQNVDVVIPMDPRNKDDDADVSDRSHIDSRISDLEEQQMTPKCSDPLSKMSVGVTDVNDDIAIVRTNMKGCRNQKKNRVDVSQKECSKEAVVTQNRSQTKLPVKRKLKTSPKSAKSTPSRGKKGSKERYGSANVLSIESFSGRKSRSGRVVLPPLEFWRNQKVIFNEDKEICGVQQPK